MHGRRLQLRHGTNHQALTPRQALHRISISHIPSQIYNRPKIHHYRPRISNKMTQKSPANLPLAQLPVDQSGHSPTRPLPPPTATGGPHAPGIGEPPPPGSHFQSKRPSTAAKRQREAVMELARVLEELAHTQDPSLLGESASQQPGPETVGQAVQEEQKRRAPPVVSSQMPARNTAGVGMEAPPSISERAVQRCRTRTTEEANSENRRIRNFFDNKLIPEDYDEPAIRQTRGARMPRKLEPLQKFEAS